MKNLAPFKWFALSIFATLALQSCGNGIVLDLDDSRTELKNYLGDKNAVGLLEVKEARKTQLSFGKQVGYPDRSENIYCTGFLTKEGTVVTSGECLKNSGEKNTSPDRIKFYMRNPDGGSTKTVRFSLVQNVSSDDVQNWAVLIPIEADELKAEFGGLDFRVDTPEGNLREGLPTIMISALQPNGSGIAKIKITHPVLDTAAELNRLERNLRVGSPTSEQARDMASACSAQIFSESRLMRMQNEKSPGLPGAPILLGNKRVTAILHQKNAFSDNKEVRAGVPQAQWLKGPTIAASRPECSLTSLPPEIPPAPVTKEDEAKTDKPQETSATNTGSEDPIEEDN